MTVAADRALLARLERCYGAVPRAGAETSAAG